jgi:hypothetical protein
MEREKRIAELEKQVAEMSAKGAAVRNLTVLGTLIGMVLPKQNAGEWGIIGGVIGGVVGELLSNWKSARG